MGRSGPVQSGLKTTDHRPQTTDHSHQPSVVTGEYDEQAVVIASGQRIRCCRRSGPGFLENPTDTSIPTLKGEGRDEEEGVLPHPAFRMLQTGDCDEPPEWS